MIRESAAGKAILLGEHAVVYGQPALAVPLSDLRTFAQISPIQSSTVGLLVKAADLDQEFWLHERDDADPLAAAINLTLAELEAKIETPLELQISSRIPIAAGLGSGAATTVAIMRALASHFGTTLDPERTSALTYEIEKLHHGTPSGIDNSVIAHERPLHFQGGEHSPLKLGADLFMVLGHCGVNSSTRAVVAGVRERKASNADLYDTSFEQIGALVQEATQALREGNVSQLGSYLNSNHTLLQTIGVSNAELDRLVETARSAGALGAKLSGAGAGGYMIALTDPEVQPAVKSALERAGAEHIFSTKVSA